MVSITDRNLVWSLARAREEMAPAKQVVVNSDNDLIRQYKLYKRSLYIVLAEFERVTRRLALVTCIEKAFMLEAQITIFAISRFLIPLDFRFRFDGQMLFSLLVTFLVFVKAVVDALSQILSVIKFESEVPSEVPSDIQGTEVGDEVKKLGDEVNMAKQKIYKTTIAFRVILFVLVLFLFHSAVKLIMAFGCKDSLWNLHNPFNDKSDVDWKGCVD